jgi:hypothetical protein
LSVELEHDQAEVEALKALTAAELKAACDQFGVEGKKTATKAELISALLDDGVTAELILKDNQKDDEETEDEPAAEEFAEPEAPVDEEDDDLVLIRMIRANNTYQIRGYQFTALHPFSLVKEKDADFLIEHDGGFRMASPKEAREFYS